MAEKTFNQKFKGYYLENDISYFPTESGVYVVQACLFDSKSNKVNIKKLIYIGKADNLNERLDNHEKLDIWKTYLKNKEILCFSYTLVEKKNNLRLEAALINSNQPLENIDYKNSFPFDKTLVNCSGSYEKLKESITVNRH